MDRTTFNQLVDETVEATARLLVVKSTEYAGGDDRLANFKRGALLTRLTPEQVALIYMAKHFDAIAIYVANQAEGTLQVLSEPIEGRIHDLINYGFLLKALLAERENVSG